MNDRTDKTTAATANDNIEVSGPVTTLTDLAAALNLDEDALIKRIGDALLRRQENDDAQ